METQYAYQDLSLKNRKGEKWKPVPGFEDYYEVSSHGRIKSLGRERELPNGGTWLMPKKILTLRVNSQYNKHTGDYTYGLIAAFFLDGISYCYSVARLVYYTFIATFSLKDKSILITYKDGESRNLNYKNLVITNSSRIHKRSYAKGRAISVTRKTLSQFNASGKFIAHYNSIHEAATKNGFDISSIAAAIRKGHLCKGFLWQAGKTQKLQKEFLQERIEQGLNANFAAEREEMSKGMLPAANLSPKNMKGEHWKDFPGYEGLYQISNKGRIKALGKVSEGKLKKWLPV